MCTGLQKDWFDLRKVYEFARKGLGGQKSLDAAIGGKPTRDRFTQTANHYRHATGYPLPAKPMSFDEAERLVARMLEEWLAKS